MAQLTPKLPLTISDLDGAYGGIKDYKSLVMQHVKMLVLTSPGEKPMDPEFGVGARRYLFELEPLVSSDLVSKIRSQFDKYLPYLNLLFIDSYQSETELHLYNIKINYQVKPLNITVEQNIPIRKFR